MVFNESKYIECPLLHHFENFNDEDYRNSKEFYTIEWILERELYFNLWIKNIKRRSNNHGT